MFRESILSLLTDLKLLKCNANIIKRRTPAPNLKGAFQRLIDNPDRQPVCAAV